MSKIKKHYLSSRTLMVEAGKDASVVDFQDGLFYNFRSSIYYKFREFYR